MEDWLALVFYTLSISLQLAGAVGFIPFIVKKPVDIANFVLDEIDEYSNKRFINEESFKTEFIKKSAESIRNMIALGYLVFGYVFSMVGKQSVNASFASEFSTAQISWMGIAAAVFVVVEVLVANYISKSDSNILIGINEYRKRIKNLLQNDETNDID